MPRAVSASHRQPKIGWQDRLARRRSSRQEKACKASKVPPGILSGSGWLLTVRTYASGYVTHVFACTCRDLYIVYAINACDNFNYFSFSLLFTLYLTEEFRFTDQQVIDGFTGMPSVAVGHV